MVGEEDRRHALERDAGGDQLQDNPTPGVEEKVLVANLEHGRRSVATWVRARSSGTKQSKLHDAVLSEQTVLGRRPSLASGVSHFRSFWTTATGERVIAGATRSACARLSSSRIALSWRCSNSPTWIPRQRSAARMTAAYISFSTGRSPNACGMIFVRRRSSRKSRSRRFV